ncbi:hypothetical protein F503_00319 [Ophiostoma piceae UAMH 11346]|uniref:Amidoligase enzyme n=1 Tax=Ophiostoma piceae (strain UAMH 11346) TaxID=1262450 RepID=S3C471_OPHP1|nr:hypothetical protein F503_00319 [Ophiostoma piceae UAMH 11346]
MPSVVPINLEKFAAGQPTGPDTVGDLCLGTEFKFLMLGLPRSEIDTTSPGSLLGCCQISSDDNRRMAHAALARAIGMRTEKDSSLAAAEGTKLVQPQAVSKPDIVEGGLDEKDYWPTHWIVKKANSVEHRPEDPRPDSRCTNGVAVSVELNSPKLAWKDTSVPPLVSKVLSRVRRFPTHVNYTCDVHVHIGRCDGTAFTLLTLKKLATVFWLAEPVIRSVRDPHSPNFTNKYTWGFEQRQYSRLALAIEGRHPASDPVTVAQDVLVRIRSGPGDPENVAEWYQYMDGVGSSETQYEALRAIWRCTSSQELGLLLSGSQREHRRLGFNFSAFGGEDERSRTNPRTIEYRILEGTLRDDLVQGWLQICGKLVELGMKGRQTDFHDIVQYLLSQQSTYEDFRLNRDLSPSWMFGPCGWRAQPSRSVLFAEFMERIGVSQAAYGPFQDKIQKEYRSV